MSLMFQPASLVFFLMNIISMAVLVVSSLLLPLFIIHSHSYNIWNRRTASRSYTNFVQNCGWLHCIVPNFTLYISGKSQFSLQARDKTQFSAFARVFMVSFISVSARDGPNRSQEIAEIVSALKESGM